MKSNVPRRKHTEVKQTQNSYLQLWLTKHRWENTQILWICNAKIVV